MLLSDMARSCWRHLSTSLFPCCSSSLIFFLGDVLTAIDDVLAVISMGVEGHFTNNGFYVRVNSLVQAMM